MKAITLVAIAAAVILFGSKADADVSMENLLNTPEWELETQFVDEYISSVSSVEQVLADIESWKPESCTENCQLIEDSLLYSDSVFRHFYYVLPENYASDPVPLLIYLHGGVSTSELRTYLPEVLTEWFLIPRILEEGMIIAFPCAQLDAVWWDTVGQDGILRIVREMKRCFNVNDSRVYVGGFSDGASGSFSLAMLCPSGFAAYFPLSGHMGVAAEDGGRGTYLPNLVNTPGFATNTDLDGLYPSNIMQYTISLARSAGAELEYRTPEGFRHDVEYLPLIEDELLEFLWVHPRGDLPEKVVWEASEPGGCEWLFVDSIYSWPLIGEDFDYNQVLLSERLVFGFYPADDFEGPGVLISGIVEGEDEYPAQRMGLMADDIIIGFEGSEIEEIWEIFEMLENKQPCDPFTITVLRNGSEMDLCENFNPPIYYWLFPRSAPSVFIEAEYEDNVFNLQMNRFCKLRLFIHPDRVDFNRELTVICNGIEVFREQIEPDIDFTVWNFLDNLDRERLFTAELSLDMEELMLPELSVVDE